MFRSRTLRLLMVATMALWTPLWCCCLSEAAAAQKPTQSTTCCSNTSDGIPTPSQDEHDCDCSQLQRLAESTPTEALVVAGDSVPLMAPAQVVVFTFATVTLDVRSKWSADPPGPSGNSGSTLRSLHCLLLI